MSGVPTFFIGHENAVDANREISTFQRALPQFLAVGVKNMLLLGYGLTLGFPTIVIPAIQGGDGRDEHADNDFSLSPEQISWFSSINLLCVPIGCVFSGLFTESLGKRRAMQIINIPMLCAWLLFHFASNTEHLYLGLCLSGLSGGLMEAPVLTYVAEVTQPQFRGMLAATGTTCVITGIFIEFILGKFLAWRMVALVSTILPLITIVALFFVPESPHWLLTKGRVDEARYSLTWLRGWVPFHRVETEFNEIYDVLSRKRIETLSNQNDGCYRRIEPYTKKNFLWPFALISSTFFFGHFGGKTPLQTYAVQIFHTLKAPIDKYYAIIFLGAAELIGCILCVILVHVTGKRPLVFISTIGAGLCFLGTATYARYLNLVPGATVSNIVANVSAIDLGNFTIIINDNATDTLNSLIAANRSLSNALNLQPGINIPLNWNETISTTEPRTPLYGNKTEEAYTYEETQKILTSIKKYVNDTKSSVLLDVPEAEKNQFLWLPLTLLLAVALFGHMGIRLIPWMLIGEIFPPACRSGASGFASGIGYVFGFLANKLFLQMLATMTLPGTFCFYSSVSLLGCIILYFALPETEGRTLFEIEEHFSGGRSLFDKKASLETDRGFDHVTVVPLAGHINEGFQSGPEIPDHIRNSAAIGVKRNANNSKKKPISSDGQHSDENQNDAHTTQC